MGFDEKNTYDVESGEKRGSVSDSPVFEDNGAAIPGEAFVVGDSLYARTQRFAAKFNIELRGIERVPEDERTDTNLRSVGTMVCSER
jgi:hypothetical protein